MYPNIDIEKTGLKIKAMLSAAGYDVKFIQEYLHLSCPQSIYKWFHGKSLPSVENLYALSFLLGVHMEDLLVRKNWTALDMIYERIHRMNDITCRRFIWYCNCMWKVA